MNNSVSFLPKSIWPWLWLLPLNAVVMAIDWSLRRRGLPRSGGIDDSLISLLQVVILLVFSFAAYRCLPSRATRGFKLVVMIAEAIFAAAFMILAWLWYVIEHGIDSL